MLIVGFNYSCNTLAASYLKVGGYSMSAIRFWTTEKGGLPHLSYIFSKTEPLETDVNTVSCSIKGAFLLIELHRVKEGMNNSNYHLQLGEAAACTKIMMEATKAITKRERLTMFPLTQLSTTYVSDLMM